MSDFLYSHIIFLKSFVTSALKRKKNPAFLYEAFCGVFKSCMVEYKTRRRCIPIFEKSPIRDGKTSCA